MEISYCEGDSVQIDMGIMNVPENFASYIVYKWAFTIVLMVWNFGYVEIFNAEI